jgi:phosphate/sulfate permease
MGGSGTVPAFSAAYGANLISFCLIPLLFGVFVFLGALLAGQKVYATIGKGVIPAHMMSPHLTIIILLSVSLSLFLANLLSVPQSTSQSTIAALVGPALYFDVLNKKKIFCEIIPAWFILPVIAFLIAYCIGAYLYNPLKKRNIIDFGHLSGHEGLRWFVIGASLYVAFAIGSNNVANAAGPIISMVANLFTDNSGGVDSQKISFMVTLIIAPFFGVGSLLFGRRVMHSTSKEIISFGPLGAAMIACITASLLLFASLTRGIPTSLVQMNAFAIIGLGISKMGWRYVLKKVALRKILCVWIVAPVCSFLISFLLTVTAARFGWVG